MCNLPLYTCVNLYLLKMEYTVMSSIVSHFKDENKLHNLCVCHHSLNSEKLGINDSITICLLFSFNM